MAAREGCESLVVVESECCAVKTENMQKPNAKEVQKGAECHVLLGVRRDALAQCEHTGFQ